MITSQLLQNKLYSKKHKHAVRDVLISTDIDEILAGLIGPFLVWHKEHYNTTYERKDVYNYDLEHLINCDREELQRRLRQFYESAHFHTIQPIDGSKEGIQELYQLSKIIAITARPEDIKHKTSTFIDDHYQGHISKVKFTGEFPQHNGMKGKICKELGIKVHIEDNLKFAYDCAQHGINVILLDCPWNQGETPKGTIRVYSWKDIPPIVEKLLRYA